MSFVVAIDGPAASGKGTLGKAVARRFGFAFLDTGLLYRAVGMKALAASRGVIDPGMAELVARELVPADLERPDLRTARAGDTASRVAAIPGVRKALLGFQRDFARAAPGAVLDGRDIGTVVCPDADVKLFVTASEAVRAARRAAELGGEGAAADPERVLAEIRRRDARDAGRAEAPLAMAPDAVLIDTTDLSIEAAVARAAAVIEARLEDREGQGRV